MLQTILLPLFNRDLQRLQDELSAYPSETAIWQTAPGISNSAGTLVLHLNGNLQHFIGAVLGNTGYVRNREAEFSTRDVPRSTLLEEIRETVRVIGTVLPSLNETAFAEVYPVKVFDEQMTTGHFLVHLSTHLNYHLGQINYHRRLLSAVG